MGSTSSLRRSTALIKLLLMSCCFAFPLPANAQIIESIDTKPNDTFTERVTISSDANRIYGALSPVDIPPGDYVTENYLESGEVDEFSWTALPPGNSFFAWITMENSNMDPIMGLFDSEGELIFFDDDSSPTSPLAPAIRGTIADDGTLNLKVSGIGDDDFDGSEEYYYGNEWDSDVTDESSVISEPHYQSGAYTLSVITDAIALQGDVDVFTLSGLTPGNGFTIAETMSESGVRLGWLADDGSIVRSSNYSELTYREQLEGIVPATGQLHIAVSGYNDELFDGQHTSSGEYVLRVDIQSLE